MYCIVHWCLFSDHWNGTLQVPWGRCSFGRGLYIQRLEICFCFDKHSCHRWTYNHPSSWSLCSGESLQTYDIIDVPSSCSMYLCKWWDVSHEQSRLYLGLGRDGLLPSIFAKVHPKYHTPIHSQIWAGIVAGVLAGLFNVHVLSHILSVGTLVSQFRIFVCNMLSCFLLSICYLYWFEAGFYLPKWTCHAITNHIITLPSVHAYDGTVQRMMNDMLWWVIVVKGKENGR